ALAMAVDVHVAAPIMAHPSLPLGFVSGQRWDLGLDPDDLATLKERSDLKILGVRFSNDRISPTSRFDRMEAEFGDRFTRSEILSGCRSPLGLPPWEHSVLNNARLNSSAPKDARARTELLSVTGQVLKFLKSELVD
ncbi:MAG: hypothetical protein ABIO99_01200, partial [Candidatus Limnocylindria bacterium]